MPFRKLLRHDLTAARRAGDAELVSLIRTLIAAIDNAEAVDVDDFEGLSEVARRHLSDADISKIVVNEGNELRHAADEYERRGNSEEARRLRALSEVADRYAQGFGESRA